MRHLCHGSRGGAEQVGSRRLMVEVAAGMVIGETNGHIISVEMKKMHVERKKNEEKDCRIIFFLHLGISF